MYAMQSKTLEQYHYGLPRIKDRILEYIAVRSLSPKRARQPILVLRRFPRHRQNLAWGNRSARL